MNDVTKVAVLIVGLAFVAVMVTNGAKTTGVISALLGGFGDAIKSASTG